MDPHIRRRIRWAIGGALVLAGLSILFGNMFAVVITFANPATPADAAAGFWVGLVLRTTLIWGLGALPFGAALGFYASLIWRGPNNEV